VANKRICSGTKNEDASSHTWRLAASAAVYTAPAQQICEEEYIINFIAADGIMQYCSHGELAERSTEHAARPHGHYGCVHSDAWCIL
jgi:hypothetical protein